MVGMSPCAPCAAGTYSAKEASAACAPCERGKHSLAGASACIECGLKDPAAGLQGTASLDDPDAPRGINCSGGVLRGVVPGKEHLYKTSVCTRWSEGATKRGLDHAI